MDAFAAIETSAALMELCELAVHEFVHEALAYNVVHVYLLPVWLPPDI
jgi:hypothetical protein